MSNQNGTAPGFPERLYLDFDSFFASAEQHFNPNLRGKPLGVVPLDSPYSGCIAVSREAKQLGIKTNVSIKEARQIIPDMIFVVARPDVYVRLHNRILAVLNTVLPVTHVRSIDEVVCHLMLNEGRDCDRLAQSIKSALAKNFSAGLTCSIGMAPTELLAKIAAEYQKPDGCVTVMASDLPDKFAGLRLSKLPGIGPGMQVRLAAAGIESFDSLWHLSPKQSRAIWGSVEGERFWSELHGFHAPRPETKKRMFGHSRNLLRDWRTPDRVENCARQLLHGASRRMRRADMLATRLTLGLRAERSRSDPNTQPMRWHRELQFAPTRDDYSFGRSLGQALAQARDDLPFSPRSVSVVLHGLVQAGAYTGDLFDHMSYDPAGLPSILQREKWDNISAAMDHLRDRFGGDAVTLGMPEDVPGGYVGGKIAFGRIPDEADFAKVSGRDDATQFCTF